MPNKRHWPYGHSFVLLVCYAIYSHYAQDFKYDSQISRRLMTFRSAMSLIISGFHRASFLSVTFINQLMHSVVDVKILLYKSLKDTY